MLGRVGEGDEHKKIQRGRAHFCARNTLTRTRLRKKIDPDSSRQILKPAALLEHREQRCHIRRKERETKRDWKRKREGPLRCCEKRPSFSQ